MGRKLGLGLMLVALLVARSASAASTQTITITLTVDYLAVTVSEATFEAGQQAAGASVIDAAIVITNGGNVSENIGFQITGEASDWTASTTMTSDANVYALGVIGATAAITPEIGDYETNDVIPTSSVEYWKGDATAAGSELGDVGTATAVAGAGTINAYLAIVAPTSTTTGAEQSITVTVSAVKD